MTNHLQNWLDYPITPITQSPIVYDSWLYTEFTWTVLSSQRGSSTMTKKLSWNTSISSLEMQEKVAYENVKMAELTNKYFY